MVRVAVVGLGQVAQKIHLPACLQIPEIDVVAACDPDSSRYPIIRGIYPQAALYASASELLQKERPDVTIIGTPPSSHSAICLEALNFDSDVLCEKPFAASLSEAEAVIATAKRLNRAIAVNTQYPFMQFYAELLSKIEKLEFGRPYFIQCWQQMYHPACNDQLPWRRALEQSTLFDFGSHPIDLVCRIFGALPSSVMAYTPRPFPELKSDAIAQMTMNFQGQQLATFAFNRVSRAPEKYLEMRIDCENASLRVSLGGVARFSVDVTRDNDKLRPRIRFGLLKGGECRIEAQGQSKVLATEARPAYADATARLLRQFLKARGPSFPYDEIERSRDILKIIFAAYESAAKGEPVKLRELTGERL